MFHRAIRAKAKPLEVDGVATEPNADLPTLLKASLKKVERYHPSDSYQQAAGDNHKGKPIRDRKCNGAIYGKIRVNGRVPSSTGMDNELAGDTKDQGNFAHLNLRQKLALVRRRLGYIRKRGHNELHDYSYVTAADLAGAVGDILAELGVLVVPRLESISHEPGRSGRPDGEHLTHVVMNYSFVDVDTTEDITVTVAGEGADAGDKAPYKAMTGALKYALLQSFLLATGDDPEKEPINPSGHSPASASQQLISGNEMNELRRLIEETGTELERVLTYYKLSSLEEMTEGTYRRALVLLKRKHAKQNGGERIHAQD